MTSLFLQITTAPADTTMLADGAETANSSVSLLDLAMAGGWAMIPLVLLSLAAVYIFFERYLTLKKAAKNPDGFTERIKSMVLAGDINGARMLCAQANTPVSRMLGKGISRIGNPLKNIETSIENVGKIEISKLERNLAALATIAGAAPMPLPSILDTGVLACAHSMRAPADESAFAPEVAAVDGLPSFEETDGTTNAVTNNMDWETTSSEAFGQDTQYPENESVTSNEVAAEAPDEAATASTTVSGKDGRFYIITGGYARMLNAEFNRQEIAELGHDAKVLEPGKGSRLFKVSVANFATAEEAQAAMNTYRQTFGETIWVFNN